jgi:hypothetical protein
MFNTDLPRRADLPTAAQLGRSTRRALLAATAILVFVVLPAEYGVDPTRVGRLLGLTAMGEIKTQLAAEAAADAEATAVAAAPAAPAIDAASLAQQIERAVAAALDARAPATVPEAAPVAPTVEAAAAPAPRAVGRSDEMAITLVPGEGAEVKLVMAAGDTASFAWTVEGGVANFDLHGDGGGQKITYEQGRGVPGAEGTLEAAFDGNHGWFWRNRGDAPITILLRTDGDYVELKRLV